MSELQKLCRAANCYGLSVISESIRLLGNKFSVKKITSSVFSLGFHQPLKWFPAATKPFQTLCVH